MASLPSLLIADGPPPKSPRVRLWRVLRNASRPHALGELFAAADIEPELFFSLVDSWSSRGLLLTQVNPLRFVMTEKARSRVHPPRAIEARKKCTVPKFSGRQRLWAAMRVLKEFDLATLCMAADAGEKGASDFLACLLRVDYVEIASGRLEGRTVFKLVRNTGPKHPIVRRRNDGPRSIVELDDRNDGRSHKHVIDYSAPGASGKRPSDGGGVS